MEQNPAPLEARVDVLTYLVQMSLAYMPADKLQDLVQRLEGVVGSPHEEGSMPWHRQQLLLRQLSLLSEGAARGSPEPPRPRQDR